MRVEGSGCGVEVSGFRVEGSGCGVEGAGCIVDLSTRSSASSTPGNSAKLVLRTAKSPSIMYCTRLSIEPSWSTPRNRSKMACSPCRQHASVQGNSYPLYWQHAHPQCAPPAGTVPGYAPHRALGGSRPKATRRSAGGECTGGKGGWGTSRQSCIMVAPDSLTKLTASSTESSVGFSSRIVSSCAPTTRVKTS